MTLSSRDLIKNTILRLDVPKVAKGELVLDDRVIGNHYGTTEITFDQRWDFARDMELDLVTHFPVYGKDSGVPILNLNPTELTQWAVKTDFFHFFVLDGAFETGLSHFGFGEFCSMVMTEDDELEDFVKHMERINMDAIRRLADAGMNGVILADDIAIQNGLILRPDMFKDQFLASMERQVELMDKVGLVPFFHSDGNYLAIMDAIVQTGFSGLHCIDKKCNVTLEELKPYSKDLCLWGHLDVYDMDLAQDDAGLNQIVDHIDQNTAFQGFILGTNSGLFPGMDLAMLRRIHRETDARKNRP